MPEPVALLPELVERVDAIISKQRNLCWAAKRMLVDRLCYCDSCDRSNAWWRYRERNSSTDTALTENRKGAE